MKIRSYVYLFISTASSILLLYLLYAGLNSLTEASNDSLSDPIIANSDESLRWRAFAEVPQDRGDPGVVSYKDKIYAISGFHSPGKGYVNNVAIYDPFTDSWEVRWNVPNPRGDLMAAVVGDNIYAIGGWIEETGAQDDNHRYDPKMNTWITMTSMITPVSGAGVTVYDDDIYIIGGYDGSTAQKSVQIYDPDNDSWSLGTPMLGGRAELGAALLNGEVYVIGGIFTAGGSSTTTNSVDIYDPVLDNWRSGTPLPEPRASFALAVKDNKIFAIGGTNNWGAGAPSTATDTAFIFDPDQDSWSIGVPMPTARWANEAAVVVDRIHVIGGAGNPKAGLTNEAYGDFPVDFIVFIPLTIN